MRASLLSGCVLLATACSFPDVNVLGSGGDGGASTTTISSGGSTTVSSGGSTGGSTGGSEGGATSSGGTGGTGGACATDLDNDGHISEACGGDDCDDTDNRAFPGQVEGFGTPRNGGGPTSELFDFNCSGQSTLFLTTMATCTLCVLEGQWSKEAVACGVPVVVYSCQTLGLACSADTLPNPCI